MKEPRPGASKGYWREARGAMLGPYQDYHLNMEIRFHKLRFTLIVLLLFVGVTVFFASWHSPLGASFYRWTIIYIQRLSPPPQKLTPPKPQMRAAEAQPPGKIEAPPPPPLERELPRNKLRPPFLYRDLPLNPSLRKILT
jgi:hypothetical protein